MTDIVTTITPNPEISVTVVGAGAGGYTPQKGIDYFTDEDIQDVNDALTGDEVITKLNSSLLIIDDNNLSTNVNSAINATHTTHAISDVTGLQTALNNKVDDSQVLTNVPANALFTDTVYTHPANHDPSIIIQDADNRFVTDAEKLTWNNKADAESTYVLPVASTTLGGVKSGTDITVDVNGNVSINDDSHNHIISNVDGLQTALDNKVDDSQVLTNVPSNAVFTDTIYTHPSTHSADMITDGTNNHLLTTALKSNYDSAYSHSQVAHAPTNAEANVNADWNATSGDAQILNKPIIPNAQVQTDWNATEGMGVILNKPTTMTPTSHSHPASEITDFDTEVDNNTNVSANTSARHSHLYQSVLDAITSTMTSAWNGLVTMFTSITGVVTTVTDDDTKIPTSGAIVDYVSGLGGGDMSKASYDTDNDGKVNSAENADTVSGFTVGVSVPANAVFTDTVYEHPSTHSADIIVDGTTNKAYTATEQSKLSGIASGAEVNVQSDWNATEGDAFISNKPTIPEAYTHPTGDGNLHVPANGTENNGKVLTASATAGTLSWETPTVGESDFLSLTDTPDTYTANGGKVPQVNSGETALEFVTPFVPSTDGGVILEDFESEEQIIPITSSVGNIPWSRSTDSPHSGIFCLKGGGSVSGNTNIVTFNLVCESDGNLSFWCKNTSGYSNLGHSTVVLDGTTILDIFVGTWQQFTFSITKGEHTLVCHPGGEAAHTMWIDDISIPAGRIYNQSISEHSGIPDIAGNGDKIVKVNTGGTALEFVDAPVIPDQLSDLSDDATHRLVTDTEKSQWKQRAMSFLINEELAVESGGNLFVVPYAMTITEIRVAVGVAPTGADLILDIHKNGTTIYTTQANRPTITTGNSSAIATDPDATSLAVGDILTLDIDQIGLTVAGSNLAVTIICEVV